MASAADGAQVDTVRMASPPDCAWCDAADSLDELFCEHGVTYYTCTCCAKTTRVPYQGVPERTTARPEVLDISGTLVFEP